MAFEPKKQNATDFHGGVKYENEKDGVEAETINNLIEGLLFAQENGGSGGGGVDQELVEQVETNKQDIARLTEKDNAFKHNTNGILDEAVFKGVTNNSINLSSEEKTSALEWLGATEKFAQLHSPKGGNLRVWLSNGTSGVWEIVQSNDASAANGNIVRYRPENSGTSEYLGWLLTHTPVNPYQCANKKYVDDSIAGVNQQNAKMYLHKIVSIQTTESPWGEIRFNLITSNHTPYTKESIINEKVYKMLDGTSFNAYVDLSGSANNYVRKSGVFYYDESNGFHGYTQYGIFVGMLFGDGSTATLMLDNHHETLTDEVIEL